MIVHLSPAQLNIVRYALDQQIVTLNKLLKDGDKVIVSELKETFQFYVRDMREVLHHLPEY